MDDVVMLNAREKAFGTGAITGGRSCLVIGIQALLSDLPKVFGTGQEKVSRALLALLYAMCQASWKTRVPVTVLLFDPKGG